MPALHRKVLQGKTRAAFQVLHRRLQSILFRHTARKLKDRFNGLLSDVPATSPVLTFRQSWIFLIARWTARLDQLVNTTRRRKRKFLRGVVRGLFSDTLKRMLALLKLDIEHPELRIIRDDAWPAPEDLEVDSLGFIVVELSSRLNETEKSFPQP